MNNKKSHIILIGFKNVGKSTVGKLLAKKLRYPFIDLDDKIQENYQRKFHSDLTCREIFDVQGEATFREWETDALLQIINRPRTVIALGGGASLREQNQILIKPFFLIYITADPQLIFHRMMQAGKPAFFPANEDPEMYFYRLWKQRQPVYSALANLEVDNSELVEETVEIILKHLESDQ